MEAKLNFFERMAIQFTPQISYKYFCYFLLLACYSFAASLQAQTTVPAQEQNDSATITVYNRDVATLRTDFLGGTPSQRAQVAEQRINDALKGTTDPKVTANSNSLGSIILIDGKLSFILTPDDTDKLSGETLELATNKTIKNLNQLIAANKESRDSKQFGKSLLTVAIATAIMLALFWLLNTIKWTLIKKIAKAVLKEKKHFLGLEFLSHQRLYDVYGKFLRITYWVFAALIIYTWLGLCLEQFPYTRPWG
ncbi:MAG: hypothetical protein KA902_04680, partial [Arenimonas sp.]|nr:hypothetical protein [Arenimonas sp.]